MNKKMSKILTILYLLTLGFMIVGATYALFSSMLVSSVSPVIEAEAATTEFIVFDAGKNINIYSTTDNFKEGMGNLSDSTFASAYIRVTPGKGEVSYKYNLYFEIEKNDFEYSTADKQAELILTITDPYGNLVEDIDGLTFVENKSVKGFDITNAEGKFFIVENQKITTSSEIMHKWNARITFVNLDSNQDVNLEKGLKGHITIEKVD